MTSLLLGIMSMQPDSHLCSKICGGHEQIRLLVLYLRGCDEPDRPLAVTGCPAFTVNFQGKHCC